MQDPNTRLIEVVYPINPHGPTVYVLNEYSSIYRLAMSPHTRLARTLTEGGTAPEE